MDMNLTGGRIIITIWNDIRYFKASLVNSLAKFD